MDFNESQFIKLAHESYPENKNQLESLSFRQLVSPHKIKLPQSVYDDSKKAIEALFQWTHNLSFIDSLDTREYPFLTKNINNYSLFMAYDFHLDENLKPKLIEVNTNASGFILSDLLMKYYGHPSNMNLIEPSLKEEFSLFYGNDNKKNSIAIIDENISEQKMNFEFYIYKSLFNKWGYECEVYDYNDLKYNPDENSLLDPNGKRIDFLYNRYCDFLLTDPSSTDLSQAYLNKACVFSPQPQEYLLLADKNRLIDFSKPNYFDGFDISEEQKNIIKEMLIPTYDLSDFQDADEIWSKRKSLFFKPKRSHGGKGTYRGKNISKKVFQQVIDNDFLAQELVPAPTFTPEGSTEPWKYDLRFYTYKSQIQLAVARSYQGQVTNFSNDYGGFTYIDFN